ncbi:hypothetical protein V6N11_050192 [Hibiscus sabdariffa]|uniref:Uncharacterized protein n=1 Tax=Hibiscus sabdariffa TaxID=183260 RepID=A0ABR2TA43_9ROSI
MLDYWLSGSSLENGYLEKVLSELGPSIGEGLVLNVPGNTDSRVENAGKSDQRIAVTLLEKKYENQGSIGGKIVKARGHTGRVQVEGHRRKFSLKKPAELNSRPQPSLLDWMSNFSQ